MANETDFAKKIVRIAGEPQPVRYEGAPGWNFCALPLPALNYMAFGAGETARIARLRCLGEAVEILSITRRETDETFFATRLDSNGTVEVDAGQVVSTGSPDPADPGNFVERPGSSQRPYKFEEDNMGIAR